MVQLGEEFLPSAELAPPALDPSIELLREIRAALVAMPELVSGMVKIEQAPPATVYVPPTDLSDIVNAVTGLRPGATAEDIGRAVAHHLNPQPVTHDSLMVEAMRELVDKIDFRLQGIGRAFGSSGPSQVSFLPGTTLPAGPVPVATSSGNSTTTPLAAGATFTGVGESIASFAQVNVEMFGRPGVVAGDGSSAEGSLYLEFSPDDTHWDISIPVLVRDPSLVIPIPLINVGAFFRVRYLNDGGVAAIASLGLTVAAGTPTTQTQFRLQTQYLPFATKELSRSIDQGISGSDPVLLTRSIAAGAAPNTTFYNMPTRGVDPNNATTTPLGGNATFTGVWFDAQLFNSVRITVKSDQQSAIAGVLVDFSNDGGTTTIITQQNEYIAAPAGQTFSFDMAARYVRVRYLNGSVAQTSFQLTTLYAVSGFPNTDVEACNDARIDRISLGQSAAQMDGVLLPNRKTIEILNNGSNATQDNVFVGFSSAVTTNTGRQLVSGESWQLELTELTPVWAIADHSAVLVTVTQIGGTS